MAALLGLGLLVWHSTASAQSRRTGVLLLAHGGSASWDAAVTNLASRVNEELPTEVAFGMATRRTMQAAVDRLVQRGVQEIVGVPLFVSSHSSVVEATEYLLGARASAPADLTIFARMDHGAPDQAHAGQHGAAEAAPDGTQVVRSTVPIRVTGALDDHSIVADILESRGRAISRLPEQEVLILVAHGPVPDADNRLWLADMRRLADRIATSATFARIEVLTVRDDAPEPVRAAATEELRDTVARAGRDGHRALVVPVLLSFGGIETGIRTRLEGLDYVMSSQGLVPDERLVRWVLDAARR